MRDFKQIEINGNMYTVKDETARTKATNNETNISNLATESLVANYISQTETISFTKGISYAMIKSKVR